jgi:hypothetical protein
LLRLHAIQASGPSSGRAIVKSGSAGASSNDRSERQRHAKYPEAIVLVGLNHAVCVLDPAVQERQTDTCSSHAEVPPSSASSDRIRVRGRYSAKLP